MKYTGLMKRLDKLSPRRPPIPPAFYRYPDEATGIIDGEGEEFTSWFDAFCLKHDIPDHRRDEVIVFKAI